MPSTTAAPTVKVSLTGQPADYDIILYKEDGTKISISQLRGVSSETIIYSKASSGATYYVQVHSSTALTVLPPTLCVHQPATPVL